METKLEAGIQVFSCDQFGQVRTMIKNGEPWFVAADVCRALGIDPTATRRLDDDEKNTLRLTQGETNRTSDTTIINEPGLYSLILGSRKPEAKAFKRWVTHEVIPSIRKNGMYATDELLDNPDLLIKVATKLRDERNARILAENKLLAQKPKVDFYDRVGNTDQLISVGGFAKLANDKGVKIGRQRLFDWMKKVRLLDKQNRAYQTGIDNGWFKVKETLLYKDGALSPYLQTFITGKGQSYLLSRLIDEYSSVAK